MKIYKYITLACLAILISCSGNTKSSKGDTEPSGDSLDKSIKLRVDTNVTVRDTFFINRTTDAKGQVVHGIYIDPDNNSKAHERIFRWSSDDNSNLKSYLTKLNKGGHKLIHAIIGNFPAEWRPVYRYHNKYYVYDPDDGAGNNTMKLTDSLLMPFFFGDGYTPFAIQSFKRNNDKWVTIKTTHYPEIYDTAYGDVDVYTIDSKTGLAVWINGDTAELMVPRQGVHNYPLIVNYTIYQKYDELDFDKVDAKKLIE